METPSDDGPDRHDPSRRDDVVADEVTRRLLADYENGRLLTICAWCRRVEIDGKWVRTPRVALAAIDASSVSHGLCPDCAQRGLKVDS